MSTSFIPSRYFIEIYDYMYGFVTTSRMYMPLPNDNIDMSKALKKWYNKLVAKEAYYKNPHIEYHAMMEDEEGCDVDLSMDWGNEYLENYPGCPM